MALAWPTLEGCHGLDGSGSLNCTRNVGPSCCGVQFRGAKDSSVVSWLCRAYGEPVSWTFEELSLVLPFRSFQAQGGASSLSHSGEPH